MILFQYEDRKKENSSSNSRVGFYNKFFSRLYLNCVYLLKQKLGVFYIQFQFITLAIFKKKKEVMGWFWLDLTYSCVIVSLFIHNSIQMYHFEDFELIAIWTELCGNWFSIRSLKLIRTQIYIGDFMAKWIAV